MPPFPTFVGPSDTAESRVVDFERSCGFFLQQNAGPGALFPFTLRPFPGYTAFATIQPEGPGRGMWAQDGRCLRVTGAVLKEVTSLTTEVNRGAVSYDTTPARFASSGDAGGEVAISSNGTISIFNLGTNVLSVIGGLTGHQVGYLDGFFLALDRTTSTVRISNLLDGLTWDPTQFVQRSTAADRWQAMEVSGQYIYLFGSETTDVFYDAGGFPFPFEPVPGALIPMGIDGAWTAKTVAGRVLWVARTADGARIVARSNGTGLPERVSSASVEVVLRAMTSLDDVIASVQSYEGHAFYYLTSASGGWTWVFDALTEQWTEDPSWNTLTGAFEAHRSLNRCYFNGSYLADDRADGRLYVVSGSVYTANGSPRRWTRRVPFPKQRGDGNWVYLSKLEVFLETGLGLATGQGSDPQVMLRLTRDGGRTWGSELQVSAGAVGKYTQRVVWNRLGRFRDGLGGVEVAMSDPIPWRVHGAAFEALQ